MKIAEETFGIRFRLRILNDLLQGLFVNFAKGSSVLGIELIFLFSNFRRNVEIERT